MNESNPFTQYYGQLLHQGNMLADYVRTGTYQQAFLSNSIDFTGKVVLDVGTGTGILAFFAIQAGASLVYAIDASDSVEVAKKLTEANGFSDKIRIIRGRVEDIELPEKVDIIVSEPIGFLLVHERMLESYIIARDKFLKPGGLMFPSTGSIILAPLSDETLYQEQVAKADFWQMKDFYGIDLSCVMDMANAEYFSQAIVGTVTPSSLISHERASKLVDFGTISTNELIQFDFPFSFVINKTAIMHGIAGWFDISFNGSTISSILSTAPEHPTTHWYQCRLLFKEPIAVNRGQSVTGVMKFVANESFSYNIEMIATIEGTSITANNYINLKDQ
eukprot:gene10053-13513_t